VFTCMKYYFAVKMIFCSARMKGYLIHTTGVSVESLSRESIKTLRVDTQSVTIADVQ